MSDVEPIGIEIFRLVQGVEVTSPGPQGPAGPPGASGGSFFEFSQEVPSSTWVINHNIGRAVSITLYDESGEVVLSDIEHGTVNQATVTWSSPTSGSALVL